MSQEPSRDRNIWEERIADLRRYDLDNLDQEPLNPADISSWPFPGLTFVRIDGILRSWDIEREKQQQGQQQQPEQDPSKPPKRMYLSEDALTGLYSQKANIGFLVLGSKTGVNYFMGISLPNMTNGNGTGQPTEGEDPIAFYFTKVNLCTASITEWTFTKMLSMLTTIKAMILPWAELYRRCYRHSGA